MKSSKLSQLLLWSLALLCLWALPGVAQTAPPVPEQIDANVSQGALRVQMKDRVVECPLKHTDVVGSISGFIARVTVTQTFQNPFDDKIEAVYVFPLPHTAAVDDMTMVIGDRKIVGVIKRRAEARQIYEQAIARGNTAALLEQERPNIFTQSVGNIPPKSEIKVVISYVDVLAYDMGGYEFHFPMVVSPRYDANKPFTGVPAGTNVAPAIGPAPADATAPVGVNPAILYPDTRNGADISLSLKLNTGVPVQDIKVTNHKAKINKVGATLANITLDPSDAIPNKDFVVRYNVAGSKPEMAVLANSEGLGKGYFMLMIQPATDDNLTKSPPREMVFLVDVSGSMSGPKTD
ncbi:MAG: VIT domain-containing protein, partial [bacterium]